MFTGNKWVEKERRNVGSSVREKGNIVFFR